MECEQIVQILESKISLFKHLGLHLVSIDGCKAHFRADLSQNLNHKNNAFGGSIYAVAVMTAYSLVLAALKKHDFTTEDIVIAKADIRYLRPIASDFDAICEFQTQYDLEEFIENLREQKKVKQEFTVRVLVGEDLCAELIGLFVVKSL